MNWIITLFVCFFLFYSQPICVPAVQDKRLFAYVGGVGELVKIDMQTFKIIKTLSDKNLGILPIIQIRPDGRELYVTGEWFRAPMIVINAKTLEITRKLSEEGFENARTGLGYDCRGKLSPDGRRIAFSCLGPAPFALIDTTSLRAIRHFGELGTNPLFEAIFSDDSKLLYILSRHQDKQGKRIDGIKLIIVETETGNVLKEVPLPELKKIKCNTNISTFTGEDSNINITTNCNFTHGWGGLHKEDTVYPFIERNKSKVIMIIELKTGRIIKKIPLPDGRGEPNQITLTPDGKSLLIGRGGYRDPGELTILDVGSKKVIKRIILEGGAASNVVFGYE